MRTLRLLAIAVAVSLIGLATMGPLTHTSAAKLADDSTVHCLTPNPVTPAAEIMPHPSQLEKQTLPRHPVLRREYECTLNTTCIRVPMQSVSVSPDGNPITVIVWVNQCESNWDCRDVWVPVHHLHPPPPDNIA